MLSNGLFTIHEFAERAHVTRDTLLHYDKVGLLPPVERAANNYRYYSDTQFSIMKYIRILQELGMTLEEIKELKDKRSPERFAKLYTEQIAQIDQKIEDWVRARKLLLTLQKNVKSVENIDEGKISVEFLPAEAIVLGELNDFSRGRKSHDAVFSFRNDISEKYPELDLNFPIWATYSQESVKRGECDLPERFYYYNPEGYDRRPAGQYAIGYTRGDYGQNRALLKRLCEFIDANNYEICGNAYEEYPLDELCIVNESEYLIRIMIRVRTKGYHQYEPTSSISSRLRLKHFKYRGHSGVLRSSQEET